MKLLLSDKFINSPKCGPKGKALQADFRDTHIPGLALRVTSTGKKTWCFLYEAPTTGARKRLSHGTYPATDLVAARLWAVEKKGLVEAGKDPSEEVPVTDKTIAQLVDDRIRLVLRADADNYLKTCMAIERIYDNDVIPVVGSVLVKDFEIKHLNLVIDPIVERGSKIQGNRVFEQVRALLNFAVERGDIKFSPIAKAKKRSAERSGTRSLTMDEIRKVWFDCEGVLERSSHVPLILKIALVTSKRTGEIAGMCRGEINETEMLWTIPKVRIKGKVGKVEDELVPLSKLAMSLIKEAMRRTNGELLFPREDGEAGATNTSIARTVSRAFEANAEDPLGRWGMAKWTPHDLRRTVGTQVLNKKNGLGITRFQKYLMLNHLSAIYANVSDKHYDQNDYLDEKREALDKWGALLEKLLAEEQDMKVAA